MSLRQIARSAAVTDFFNSIDPLQTIKACAKRLSVTWVARWRRQQASTSRWLVLLYASYLPSSCCMAAVAPRSRWSISRAASHPTVPLSLCADAFRGRVGMPSSGEIRTAPSTGRTSQFGRKSSAPSSATCEPRAIVSPYWSATPTVRLWQPLLLSRLPKYRPVPSLFALSCRVQKTVFRRCAAIPFYCWEVRPMNGEIQPTLRIWRSSSNDQELSSQHTCCRQVTAWRRPA